MRLLNRPASLRGSPSNPQKLPCQYQGHKILQSKNASKQHSNAASRRTFLMGSFCPCCCGSCKGKKDGWYDKFFAYAMANGMQSYEAAVAPYKYQLLKRAFQKQPPKQILEIGIGAGPNLQYLMDPTEAPVEGLQVTGLDPNPYMFTYAQQAAERSGLPKGALNLQVGVAEDIPAADSSFDAVICTLVLCSVPDVAAAVLEMRRVLKPGGKAVFLEHVIAAESRPWLRLGQRALNPLQQVLADGCHLDRNPISAYEAAGFRSLESDYFDVPGMGVISPHVSGVATV